MENERSNQYAIIVHEIFVIAKMFLPNLAKGRATCPCGSAERRAAPHCCFIVRSMADNSDSEANVPDAATAQRLGKNFLYSFFFKKEPAS